MLQRIQSYARAQRRRNYALRYRGLARGDPSRTNGIVRLYIGDLNRRWQRISSLIWQTVVVNDALRLEQSGGLPVAAARAATPFQFRNDPAGKTEDFLRWLNDALDDEVLEITRGPAGRITSNSRWQDRYVRASYSRGLEHAQDAMRRAGIPFDSRIAADLFNAPIHADSLALLYTRQFTDLQGITQATSGQISRVLTEGLARGQGPREMARNMRTVIGNIGVSRSRVLARTETIRVHAESTLNRYQDAGVQDVTVLAEFLTANDDRVCPDCQALETGEPIPINEARGTIPVHANCLPGDALVSARGRITSATKRWYDGDMVVLKCAGSLPLSVTPNHPVFTSTGWVPASSIDVGDQIANPGIGKGVPWSDGQDIEIPSRAEDVAGAFFSSSEVVTVEVPVSSPDFHSDGVDGQVAIIGTHRSLLDHGHPSIGQRGGKFVFHWRHMCQRFLFALCLLGEAVKSALRSPDCVVCGGNLSSALAGGHATPLKPFGIGLAAQFNPIARESAANGATISVESFRDSQETLTAEVQSRDLVFREVISKDHNSFSGFVYNFEATEHYYIANGYASHNCRCVWLPTLSERAA